MKLIAFLVLLLTFSSTKQACAAGCLKCDASSNCVVPDISQGYVLSNNAAVKTSLTNCQVVSSDGTCALCNSGYFLDISTVKCAAVPTLNVITNCSIYGNQTTCKSCLAGFYLNNSACSAVTTTIANCTAYATATTCSTCSNNYVLSLDSTSCVSVSSLSNCSGYSYVTCKSCANNFYLNNNAYINTNIDLTIPDNKVALANYASKVIGQSNYIGQNVCTSTATTNCSTFTADTSTCTACATGYYLNTSGSCIKNPLEPILNCGIYNDAVTCASCVAGFTLNSNACVAIATTSLVANCLTYDTTISTVNCLACGPTYYLANNNNTATSCVARTNSANIANCSTKTNNADTCSVCASGYTLNNNSTACLANLSNCSVNAALSTTLLTCTTCANTFKKAVVTTNGANQTTCIAGTINNCATYNDAGDTCTACSNGFSLASNTCTAQPAISGCTTFSQTANACTTCTSGTDFNFLLQNSCQTILAANLIANCATYGGNTLATPTCMACATGYYMNVNGTCTQITITNCLVQSAVNVCTTCAAGYVRSYNNAACIASLTNVTTNCFDYDASDANTLTISTSDCNICNQGYIPFDFVGRYSCFTTAEATQLNNGTAVAIDGCIKYASNFGCAQCGFTGKMYLNDDGLGNTNSTTCVTSCATGSYFMVNLVTSSNASIINNYNVCSNANDGCMVRAQDLSTNNLTIICLKCKSSYFPVISAVNSTSYSAANPDATGTTLATVVANYIPGLYSKYLGVTCVAKSTANLSTSGGTPYTYNANTNPDLILNCAVYKLNVNNDYQCLRCNYGYTGTVTIVGNSGFITACNSLTTCDANPNYFVYNDNYINNIASCRKCQAAGQIPVIGLKTTSSTDLTFNTYGQFAYAVTTKTNVNPQ